MLIKKLQSIKKNLGQSCTVREYNGISKNLSCARSKINGRLPEKGTFTNKECEEIYFVISGEGKICSQNGTFEINEGDVYHFDKGEKYYVEGKNLDIVISNSPKRTASQFEINE